MDNRQKKGKGKWSHWRITLCGVLCVLPLLLLLCRLWQVQVVHGNEYLGHVKRQSTRFIVTPPVRGQIFFSDGQLLAGNVSHYDLTLNPSEMRTRGGYVTTTSYMLKVTGFISDNLVKRSNELDIEKLRDRARKNMAQPMVIFRDLTEEEIARCIEYTPKLKALEVTQRIEREYPFPGVATHVLGYTGWHDRSLHYTSEHGRKNTFNSRELRGNSGLEQYYDKLLAGSTGFKIVLMDSMGYFREHLPGGNSPVDGMDRVLTGEAKAQQAADAALAGHAGALVALNVEDGAILAAASAPTYNLAELNGTEFRRLLRDTEGKPMFNRAFSGKYMPGSIVKPLVALAALEKGIATGKTTYDCTGAYTLGSTRIGCARRYGHGPLDMTEAIAVSCNPYFINLGVNMGLEPLESIYRAAGFGEPVDGDFQAGVAGMVPSHQAALKAWGRKWLKIDTAFASIGQGGIMVTPLQAAVYVAALANGGTVWHPYMVKQIRRKDGQLVRAAMPRRRNTLPVSDEHLQFVCNAMRSAVVEEGASASLMKDFPIPVAAKTGTAEVGEGANRHKNTWFVCFGPLPKPRFAVACIIERGESGGRTAAPVVLDFLSKWLEPGNGEARN